MMTLILPFLSIHLISGSFNLHHFSSRQRFFYSLTTIYAYSFQYYKFSTGVVATCSFSLSAAAFFLMCLIKVKMCAIFASIVRRINIRIIMILICVNNAGCTAQKKCLLSNALIRADNIFYFLLAAISTTTNYTHLDSTTREEKPEHKKIDGISKIFTFYGKSLYLIRHGEKTTSPFCLAFVLYYDVIDK